MHFNDGLFLALSVTCVTFLIHGCHGDNDTESLYFYVTSQTSDIITPVANWMDMMHVGVSAFIVNLNEFNQLSGELVLTLVFNTTWFDSNIHWNPYDFGGKNYLMVKTNDIWMPQLSFRQSFDSLQSLNIKDARAHVYPNGLVEWFTGNVLHAVCSVDATYFPFDTQICPVTLTSLYYTSYDLVLFSTESQILQHYYTENSQWRYLKGEIVENESDLNPELTFVFHFKRRAEFFIVYIIMPVVFLSHLNLLVFVMPVSFGERSSVAITTFLSFVVYMQIVNQHVPPSSQPTPYIFYYLMFVMAYSSTIMCLCIVSLKIHSRDTPVPKYARIIGTYAFGRGIRYLLCKPKAISDTIRPRHDSGESITDNVDTRDELTNSEKQEKKLDVEWTMLGSLFDKLCLVCLLLIYWASSLITCYQLYNNTGIY